MTKIDFYVGMSDRLNFAYRLVRKAYRSQAKIVVTANGDVLRKFDDLLWREVPIDFIPHCFAEVMEVAKQTPVVLTEIDWQYSSYQLLINLGDTLPCHFSRYERLLEVVGNASLALAAARERYKEYKKRGYLITNHKIIS